MEADWDLHAVVRSCSATATTATSTTVGCTSSHLSTSINTQQDWNNSFSVTGFQDLLSPRTEPTYAASELHDIYKPFYLNSRPEHRHEASKQRLAAVSPQSLPISPLSVLNGLTDLSAEQRQQKNQTQHIMFNQLPLQRQHLLSVSNGSKSSPRSSKKRKNNLKKVCHVPVEKLSSDVWSWRKYGQKPIKGSPYPRGYYKCSTSKGCPARKQVERNRSDPGMFIVTYASEHNHPMPTHRSSLAGTTRTRPSGEDSGKTTAATSSLPEISSPVTSNSEKMESSQCHEDNELVEAEDDDLSVSDVPFDDDFFAGLEDLTGRECGSGDLVENLWPLED